MMESTREAEAVRRGGGALYTNAWCATSFHGGVNDRFRHRAGRRPFAATICIRFVLLIIINDWSSTGTISSSTIVVVVVHFNVVVASRRGTLQRFVDKVDVRRAFEVGLSGRTARAVGHEARLCLKCRDRNRRCASVFASGDNISPRSSCAGGRVRRAIVR